MAIVHNDLPLIANKPQPGRHRRSDPAATKKDRRCFCCSPIHLRIQKRMSS
jgi:hypothetical protein